MGDLGFSVSVHCFDIPVLLFKLWPRLHSLFSVYLFICHIHSHSCRELYVLLVVFVLTADNLQLLQCLCAVEKVVDVILNTR